MGSEAPTPTLFPDSTAVKLELRTILASSDLSVGMNRVAFALIDSQSSTVRTAEARVSSYFLTDDGTEGPKEVVTAVFRKWPMGVAGVYTSQLTFDRPGQWGIEIVVTAGDGTPKTSRAVLTVDEQSATPAIGSPAPRSNNKTSRNVGKLEELTTDPNPDPALYNMTIAEAIKLGRPLVVIFATPAFCETATCGPQLEVVKALKSEFLEEANFIHIEVYDNPLEMRGDLSKGRISPTLTEWNLPSEPWTFVLDDRGLVGAKFEGFATGEELREALAGVLR